MRNDPSCWHNLSPEQCAAALDCDPAHGLTNDEALLRQRQYGENRLREQPKRSRWRLLLDQFRSLLILILLGAAVLAWVIGDATDATVILVVVLLNALLGFYQEHRAEATLEALKRMLTPTARIRREGRVSEIDATQLVPGDLVLLEAGDRVPADGRLLASHAGQVSEAALTGESQPVGKHAQLALDDSTPLAERRNMAYLNTIVTRGRMELLVTATGMHTEMGRLSGLLEEASPAPTPLQVKLDTLGKRLAAIAVAVIGVIFTLGLLRNQPLVDTILTSIALSVAAIPEGLPAVVTVTLALGMHRMAKQRAIVRKLAAVETLGCTTVICTDKTGTLTLNQMTARAIHYQDQRLQVSGEGYSGNGRISAADGGTAPDLAPMLLPAALANDSRIRDGELIGDPTEGALLALAAKAGLDAAELAIRYPRIAEIPFDSDRKFMATFHHDGERVHLYIKGAPDVLLAHCSTWLAAEGEAPLDEARLAALRRANEAFASEALRVIALARKDIAARDFDPAGNLLSHVQGLTFLGLAGIIDPPRPEARDAIRLCREAGIQVKMITGDHRLTAAAIASDLGLDGDIITGAELDGLTDTELTQRLERVTVFARVAPEHKVRIVHALQSRGDVVAMTGDGVNDAPALKHADIGIAMGSTGTEVAKEAATMVLTDDNFATIVRAVREGRTIYDNIIKFVRFQLSTNMGAIQAVLGASLLGWPTPFTAIQILWINIIMDGPPAMTLGVEPSRPGIMRESPRPRDARILTAPRLGQLLLYGFTMAVGTLLLYRHGQTQGTGHAMTLAFTTFVLFQVFNAFNARVESGTAFNRGFLKNRQLWLALALVVALQVLVVHWGPAQRIFHTTDLQLHDWLLASATASSVLLLDEARKLLQRLWYRRRPDRDP